jgi:hypothetical protein
LDLRENRARLERKLGAVFEAHELEIGFGIELDPGEKSSRRGGRSGCVSSHHFSTFKSIDPLEFGAVR